jgi:DNA polymerase III sliding clamp (beta) subunit (PCNA family)
MTLGLLGSANSGRRMTRLHVLEASEFPAIGSFNGNTDTVTVGMTHDQLKAVVKQMLPFVSDDDSRPVLTGIYLYGKLPEEGGQPVKFDLAAADGFRLAHDNYSMPVSFKSRPKFDHLAVIVPGTAWTELAKFIGPDDGKPIHLSFHLKTVKDSDMESGMLQFETDQGNGLRVNLLEGNFPNYHEVMKEAPEYAIIPLPVKEVANAAKRAALLIKKGAGVLHLICDVEHKQMRVESQDAELGEFSESVPVEWRPEHEPVEGFEIGFNVGKFAEMVRAADYDSDETIVELRVSKNSAPGFVHVGSYTHVLMPMHIGDTKDVKALEGKSKIPNGSEGNDSGKKAEPTPKAEEPAVADTGKGAGNGQGDPAAIATIEAKLDAFNGNLALAFSQFAGDNLAPARQALMKVLTGEERPLAKCGFHALEAAYVAYRRAHPKVPEPKKGTMKVNLVASYGGVP